MSHGMPVVNLAFTNVIAC